MGVKLPIKAEKRTKTKNATSSQKLPLSVVRCIAAVAFLVLWASINNQQGEKHSPLIEVSLYVTQR
ncbi:hypothetical protein C1N70_11755 [Cytobacillus firmus]